MTGGRLNVANTLGEPEPGIAVTLTCEAGDVVQEQDVDCNVATRGKGGYEGVVTLQGSYPGATVRFDDSTVQTGQSTGALLDTTRSTPVGCNALEVVGTSGIHEAESSASICVDPFGTISVSGSSVEQKPLGKPPGCFGCQFVQFAETRINLAANLEILRVSGTTTVQYPFAGQIELTLISPTGTAVIVRPAGTVGSLTNFPWVVEQALDGQPSAGQWTMRARITQKIGGSGRLVGWALTVKGPPF